MTNANVNDWGNERAAKRWDSEIALKIDKLQTSGRNVYVYGFTSDGRYALIVDRDNERCSIAPVGTVNGLGRWETNGTPDEYLAERFPLR